MSGHLIRDPTEVRSQADKRSENNKPMQRPEAGGRSTSSGTPRTPGGWSGMSGSNMRRDQRGHWGQTCGKSWALMLSELGSSRNFEQRRDTL